MSIVLKKERSTREPSCEGINLTDAEIEEREAAWEEWNGGPPATSEDEWRRDNWVIGMSDDGPE